MATVADIAAGRGTEAIGDVVARMCIAKYKGLPKTGKPTCGNEWTVLAGVVAVHAAGNAQVVALGAGTKCLGHSQLRADGAEVRDSHAEVLTRRAFIRYM